MKFTGILRGDTNRVQVENVGFAFGKPQEGLVPPGESLGGVQTMIEVPDDPIVNSPAALDTVQHPSRLRRVYSGSNWARSDFLRRHSRTGRPSYSEGLSDFSAQSAVFVSASR